MDNSTKDVIMECEGTDRNEKSLAMDIICYVNAERRKWKSACIGVAVLELLTLAGIAIYLLK